jgi:hypothetical protein
VFLPGAPPGLGVTAALCCDGSSTITAPCTFLMVEYPRVFITGRVPTLVPLSSFVAGRDKIPVRPINTKRLPRLPP